MSWNVNYLPEALEDLRRLDGSQRILIRKAIQKVCQNPLPETEGGYGKLLGNKNNTNLSGFLKVKLCGAGLRIVYMKIRKKVRRIIQILITGISLYLFLTAASIYLYATKDETCHADAAIILGAGASDKGVSPVYRERIHHGVWLYEHGYVNAIIMTGGMGDGNTRSDAYIAKEYAITQGIPEEDIYLEEHSKVTQENIKYAKAVMEDYNLKTALVVSDPYHMKRAMLMAKDYKIEAYSSPTKTSMYRSRKKKIPFLLREEFFYVGYRLYRVIDRI